MPEQGRVTVALSKEIREAHLQIMDVCDLCCRVADCNTVPQSGSSRGGRNVVKGLKTSGRHRLRTVRELVRCPLRGKRHGQCPGDVRYRWGNGGRNESARIRSALRL